MKLISTIVYIVGIIIAVWCVLDIFKKKIDLWKKIVIAILVLAFSWVGAAVYYFLVRDKL